MATLARHKPYAALRRVVLGMVMLMVLPVPKAQAQTATEATDKDSLLMMNVRPLEGVDLATTQVITDLVVQNLRRTKVYEVLSQADVQSLLEAEQDAQLAGCNDDSCIAEIAGALNAAWLVNGSLGLLGGDLMLTLKLLDTRQGKLTHQISRPLPPDQDEIPRMVEVASYELVGLKAPELPAWYSHWWVWAIVGGVVVAGAAAGTAIGIATAPQPAQGNLGQVTF